ncbi:MAG: plastocyanin/azurin family copper-binding protein [Gemmatimonadota bacterium]|nr:plastocyanin/azurin family copper-binding protein [Gemmatimonadota bacterium]
MLRLSGGTVIAAVALMLWMGSMPAEVTDTSAGAVTHIVKMVDVSDTEFKFEPAELTVKMGDVVQFVATSATPHNVDFRVLPDGADLGDQAVGPYLMENGATYDVTIDGRFVAGEYGYVCTPHEFMGMTGAFTVAGE